MEVTPHIARHDAVTTTGKRRRSSVDGRTTRHPGYAASQRVRKRIEEAFGWTKMIAGLGKTKSAASNGSAFSSRSQWPPTISYACRGFWLMMAKKSAVIGKWRIFQSDQYETSDLDLVEPAFIQFNADGTTQPFKPQHCRDLIRLNHLITPHCLQRHAGCDESYLFHESSLWINNASGSVPHGVRGSVCRVA